jgi:hypothetical protein
MGKRETQNKGFAQLWRGRKEPQIEERRKEVQRKVFRNIDGEIGIRRVAGCKNKEQCQKIRIYMIKCKEKWEKILSMRVMYK